MFYINKLILSFILHNMPYVRIVNFAYLDFLILKKLILKNLIKNLIKDLVRDLVC
jgi:hypothetical protein